MPGSEWRLTALQQLGTGRARDTAEWPTQVDRLILNCLLNQIDIDTTPGALPRVRTGRGPKLGSSRPSR